jgi:hypothetical protein
MKHHFLAMACLLAAVSFAIPSSARDHNWQTATFLGFGSAQSGGSATMPMGNGTVTIPISSHNYWFRLENLDYCLSFPSRFSGRVPNLTINGKASIAVEGRHVYVRDDDGKEWKFSIITKVAR